MHFNFRPRQFNLPRPFLLLPRLHLDMKQHPIQHAKQQQATVTTNTAIPVIRPICTVSSSHTVTEDCGVGWGSSLLVVKFPICWYMDLLPFSHCRWAKHTNWPSSHTETRQLLVLIPRSETFWLRDELKPTPTPPHE